MEKKHEMWIDKAILTWASQAVGWFMGLFGRKKEGMYAKCVWRLFATSAAIVMALMAVAMVWSIGKTIYEKRFKETYCYDADCCYSIYISEHVYYHNLDDGKGYVFNSQTGEKTVKDIRWIARPEDDDSLVCFSNGKKRGYFSKYTGKVVIEPKYNHAWVFSDGLASVEEDGYIKFIDGTGKVVIDKKMAYIPNSDGYVFHGGYCVVRSDDNELLGLMDKTGRMVLPMVYSLIERESCYDLWRVQMDGEMAVLDRDMKPVVPLTKGFVFIGEGTIDMTMTDDHTMRKYDLRGQLINDFYVSGVQTMEYEKDEIQYRTRTHDDDGSEYAVPFVESYHPHATARLRAYMAGDGYQGLMTAEGHVVTMPLYKNISAMGYDLYLCEVSNGDNVMVNGKGEIVK